MAGFFSNSSLNNFEHARVLASYEEEHVAFNIGDINHLELLKDCSKELESKLLELQSIDKKAVVGFTLGSICLGLSFVLPLTLVSALGFTYGAYQLGLRERAQVEYNNALENLINCCKWSLGKVDDPNLINHEAIRQMVTTLAPLVSEQELRDYIDDVYENIFVEQQIQTNNGIVVMDYKLNNEEATLYYQIYGHEQGGFLAILKGIGYAIRNSFNALKDSLLGSTTEASQQPQPA